MRIRSQNDSLQERFVRNRFLLLTYPIFVIATIAMSYELVEWVYATNSDPLAGAAYLGSQGDIWDAQKDMLMDTSGAILATCFFFWIHGVRRIRTLLATDPE